MLIHHLTRGLCQSGLSLSQQISENPECLHIKVRFLCSMDRTTSKVWRRGQLAPGEAQPWAEVHSWGRLLHVLFLLCSGTSAGLSSDGVHAVGLLQGIAAQPSPCAILETVRGGGAKQHVSITQNRLGEETPKERAGASLGSEIAGRFYFLWFSVFAQYFYNRHDLNL